MQDMHGPNQCLEEFMTHYPHTPGCGSPTQTPPNPGVDNYAVYNGMAVAADQVFGNLTGALKVKGMYNNTLIVLTSDNGGPAATIVSGHAGNNFPARAHFLIFSRVSLLSTAVRSLRFHCVSRA